MCISSRLLTILDCLLRRSNLARQASLASARSIVNKVKVKSFCRERGEEPGPGTIPVIDIRGYDFMCGVSDVRSSIGSTTGDHYLFSSLTTLGDGSLQATATVRNHLKKFS